MKHGLSGQIVIKVPSMKFDETLSSGGHVERQTDMMKKTGNFSGCVNVPKNECSCVCCTASHLGHNGEDLTML